jgi:hypothetical protein
MDTNAPIAKQSQWFLSNLVAQLVLRALGNISDLYGAAVE